MLTKCYNCRYFVREDEEICFNCGTENPGENGFWYEINFKRVILIFFLSYDLEVILFFLTGNSFFNSIITSLFISFFVTFVAEVFFLSLQNAKVYPGRLNAKFSTAENRIRELSERKQNINKILSQISKSDTEKLQDVKIKLVAAKEIIESQMNRYELQADKIKLIRIQNEVAPVLFDFQNLKYAQTENALKTVAAAKKEVKKLKSNIDASYRAEDRFSELDSFTEQLAETENSYNLLRESLIGRQAALALRDISDTEDKIYRPDELEEAIETFNINTELTELSSSFEELENEYKKLKSDNPFEEKLLS